MTNYGLVLVVGGAVLAAVGLAGWVAARRSASQSRCAALTLFGHGALSTSGALLAMTVVHFHNLLPLMVHAHPVSQAIADVFECDLEIGCGAVTVGILTAVILAASFAVTQASARLLLRRCRAAEDPAATAGLGCRLGATPGIRLLVVRDPAPDAFSFALLRGDRRRVARAESVVVVTRGLVDLLESDELEAAVRHELAHVSARDDRYIPFFRTLSSLLFFDPVLRVLRGSIARHHEFAADRDAVRAGVRPRALARALLKVYLTGRGSSSRAGLFGSSRPELLARIEALLAMAEAGTA